MSQMKGKDGRFLKGHSHTPEIRKKLSEIAKGWHRGIAYRSKQAWDMRGKPKSEETKRRMSESMKKKWEERRARGVTSFHTEETKKLISMKLKEHYRAKKGGFLEVSATDWHKRHEPNYPQDFDEHGVRIKKEGDDRVFPTAGIRREEDDES